MRPFVASSRVQGMYTAIIMRLFIFLLITFVSCIASNDEHLRCHSRKYLLKLYIEEKTLTALQRYLTIKDMTPEERKKVNPKVVFFAGKAAPGCESTSLLL